MDMFTIYYIENYVMKLQQIEGETNAYVFATSKIKTSDKIWIKDCFGNLEEIL